MRRAIRSHAAVAFALLLLAAGADAQRSRPTADEMATLRADWLRARDSVQARRAARTATRIDSLTRELTDTVRVSRIEALVRPDLRAVADSGLRRAARVIASRYGDSLNTALGLSTVLIGTPAASTFVPILDRAKPTIGIGFGPISKSPSFATFRGNPVEGIENAVLRVAATAYHAQLDVALRRWLASAVPTTPFESRDIVEDRMALLAAGREARRCLSGAFERCAPVVFDTSSMSVHVRGRVRVSLLQYAVDVGGADAWRRLRADSTAPLRDRLAAAAGLNADTVVQRWSRQVSAARSDVTPRDFVGVFGVLALAFTVSRRRSA